MSFDVGRFVEDLPKRSSFDDMVAILWQCAGREEGARLLSEPHTMEQIAKILYGQLYEETGREFRPEEYHPAESTCSIFACALARYGDVSIEKRWRVALVLVIYEMFWSCAGRCRVLEQEAYDAESGEWDTQFEECLNKLKAEGRWNEFVDGTVATMISFMTLCEKTLAKAAETGGETDGRT